MPGDAPPHLHARQGERGTGQRCQEARAGGLLCRTGGRAFIEARQGYRRLLQATPPLGCQQRQQPPRQGQEPRQPLERLFLPDQQGLATQRESLTRGQSRASAPPPRSCRTAWGRGSRSTGAWVPWTRHPHRGRRAASAASFRCTSVRAERPWTWGRGGRAGPPRPRPPSQVPVVSCRSPLAGSNPATSCRSSTRAMAPCQGSSSRRWRWPRPGAGVRARSASAAAANRFSSVAWWRWARVGKRTTCTRAVQHTGAPSTSAPSGRANSSPAPRPRAPSQSRVASCAPSTRAAPQGSPGVAVSPVSGNGLRETAGWAALSARVARAALLPAPAYRQPGRPPLPRTRCRSGVSSGASAPCPGGTAPAIRGPEGSAAAAIRCSGGRSGRWAVLCPRCLPPPVVPWWSP